MNLSIRIKTLVNLIAHDCPPDGQKSSQQIQKAARQAAFKRWTMFTERGYW